MTKGITRAVSAALGRAINHIRQTAGTVVENISVVIVIIVSVNY